ncbi:TetR family transcriptional regulator [Labrys miyagiensis]|uniref:TetR family transcriptional regulator n=1 Tax=Labrys miyagiensis TaxID=346912 RepID=A0ABQ6CGC4_9HYPH|nr:TetR/AcrR family transcriptional regulator [Labrys miyagiensis]GLS18960.1 TetR family transcriptional regulator [Labrys miyagiensis]
MARRAGSDGAKTAEAIRAAGLRLIFEHGYEGMSLRDLAEMVGVQPGSLYNHIATKQALLFELLSGHMRTLTAALDEALAGVEGPLARLDAFVDFHLRYHLTRKMEVFVNNSELRSLEPRNRAVITGLRRDYERRLADILAEGAADGVFTVPDVKVATYAILAQLTGVVGWYAPDGRLSEDEVVALHYQLVLRGIRESAQTIRP